MRPEQRQFLDRWNVSVMVWREGQVSPNPGLQWWYVETVARLRSCDFLAFIDSPDMLAHGIA